MLAGGRASAAQHPGQFLHATGIVELCDPGQRSTFYDLFGHEVVPMPCRRNGGQMCLSLIHI